MDPFSQGSHWLPKDIPRVSNTTLHMTAMPQMPTEHINSGNKPDWVHGSQLSQRLSYRIESSSSFLKGPSSPGEGEWPNG